MTCEQPLWQLNFIHGQIQQPLYSSLSNSSPGHSYFFLILFLPGQPLLKTGSLIIFEKIDDFN